MAEHHARQGLDLHVLQGVALSLSKVADLLLREEDVLAVLCGERCEAGLDLHFTQPKIVTLPVVELDRHLPDGRIAPLGDVVQRIFHDAANLLVRLRRFGIADAGLQVSSHRVSCFLFRASVYETMGATERCSWLRTRR